MKPVQCALDHSTRSDFEVIVADTLAAKRIHYRLRYQVFCLEKGFEDPARFLAQQERDEYDERSAHLLVRCINTQEWVATTRVVFREGRPLPMESLCPLREADFSRWGAPGAEVSRLLTVPGCRTAGKTRSSGSDGSAKIVVPFQRRPDQNSRCKVVRDCSRARILHRTLLGAAAYARDKEVRDLGFFLTAGLKRIVAGLGVECIAIGEPCEHRGLRYPYRADVQQAYLALRSQERAELAREYPVRHYRMYSELETEATEPTVLGGLWPALAEA